MGRGELSLSEVAVQAGVSRPTLYRWFDSKKDLLDAFAVWERLAFERAVADATAGLPERAKSSTPHCGSSPSTSSPTRDCG